MIPDMTQDPRAVYYHREFQRALLLIDEGNMRTALARLAREASRNGIAIPLDAASMIGRLLTTPMENPHGGQFLPPTTQALRVGRVEALLLHTSLKVTQACKIVAYLEEPMLHYKTILNGFKDRETFYQDAAKHTGGHHSFKPKGDPQVDALLFADEDHDDIFMDVKLVAPKALDSVKAFLSN
jgi:hypothetical protein